MGHMIRERAWTEIERRIVSGDLASGEALDEDALATDLEVDTPIIREALCRLERDGFVRPEADGGFAVSPLSEIELREGYPVAILLEGLAVRSTDAFPSESLARLRAINEAMAAEIADATVAATRDWEFHNELVSHCGNEQLLSTLRPLKRLLLRYECTFMRDEELVERAVRRHGEIVDALERGDREQAATLVENNFRESFPTIVNRL